MASVGRKILSQGLKLWLEIKFVCCKFIAKFEITVMLLRQTKFKENFEHFFSSKKLLNI